jgi:membrane-bound metal-dependent hydrolase YbcI (DUF457 family)
MSFGVAMDIVTHTVVGTIIASPMLSASPLTAGCFVLGSVLPDFDALSRSFGKVAFLRWHQTYTHSLPVIFVVTILLWPLPGWLGIDELWAPAALGAGMLLHALVDATNTYGVALLAPLSRKRYCTEWVFFIDGIMIVVSLGFLAAVFVQSQLRQSGCLSIAIAYGAFVVAYWVLRWLVHRRAACLAPAGTQCVIPSAIIPWRFLAYRAQADVVQVFELSAIHGATTMPKNWQTFDSKYESWLNQVTEYRLMRELSSGYHAVEVAERDDKTEIFCRDLRIRNFGGSFGQLELTFAADGKVVGRKFRV